MPAQLRLLVFLALLGAAACNEDDDVTDSLPIEPAVGRRMLVMNEGNFRRGNAGVSLYDFGTSEVVQQALSTEVAGTLDVLQSATVLRGDSLLVLVSNNTNELVVIGAGDLSERARYAGAGSPRYLHELADGRWLISDLYAGNLLVIEPQSGDRNLIAAPRHTEQIIEYDGLLYVAAPSSQSVVMLDRDPTQIIDSIRTNCRVSALAVSPAGMLYAAAGVQSPTDTARLLQIEPQSQRIERVITLTIDEASLYPRLVATATGVAMLQRDLHLFDDDANGSVTRVPLPEVAQPYGLGIDPFTGNWYVGDANATFSGSGLVHVFENRSAGLSFPVGPLPGSFIFLD